MARDEGAGGGTVLLAFILGAVSGAAVALLYAPATGRETREYLGDRAREGGQRAARLFADVAARVEDTLATVQATVGAPVRQGRALLSGFRAAIGVLREFRQGARGRRGRSEDDDALFI